MTEDIQVPEIAGDPASSTSEDAPGGALSHHTVQVGGGAGGTHRRGERIGFHRYFPFEKSSGVKI